MMTVITRVNKLFLSLALLSTRTLATTTFFLTCIGFFDQWLIGGILDGCVAIIWAGKAHVRCVPVYITTLEHNKTPTAKRIQTILDFPSHKNENQLDVKILLNSLL